MLLLWYDEVYSFIMLTDLVSLIEQCLVKYRLSNKRIHKTTTSAISLQWKVFDCELCKKRFPDVVKTGNK